MRRVLASVSAAAGVVVLALGSGALPGAVASTLRAGSAGVARGLPPTDSAVTVAGRGHFSGLSVTVSQTKHLVNQAISVSWTGAAPTVRTGKDFSANFLQIFQCWGGDDGTVAANPGPPPEQCEFGGQPTVNPDSKLPGAASKAYTRVVGREDLPSFDPSGGVLGPGDPGSRELWKPFRAVDGTVVGAQIAPDPKVLGVDAWQNPFFAFTTTNEDPWGRTSPDGTGADLFQADTGLEAPGLGCGQKLQAAADGTKVAPKCWLVIVPRGAPEQENPPQYGANEFPFVFTSPLTPGAWANRVAVPLEFTPLESSCAAGAKERQIVGGELSTSAVHSWQPTLCAKPGSPPFAYSSESEDQARQQLLSHGLGAAGMAVVSQPLDPKKLDPANPIVYAPLTLSGVVIGFNIERIVDVNAPKPEQDAQAPLAGTRVAQVNLTPRLVAKLLTESYFSAFPQMSFANPPPDHAWIKSNPAHVGFDPDFWQFNDEFRDLNPGGQNTLSGLVVEASTSDAAELLWRWVLADPEATAWLGGAPDPWGMVVNPLYLTDKARNPTGVGFAATTPRNFPKSDPYCYKADVSILVGKAQEPPLPRCRLDFQPDLLTMESAAQATRAANDGAKTDASTNLLTETPASYWKAGGPQSQGRRSIVSVTDAASAARFGLQTASLSRAGDDTPTRSFVAPEAPGLIAGAKAMGPTGVQGVLAPDPSATAAGAYPLALLSYAAVAPAGLDGPARADYAAFITYGAGDGQSSGVEPGRLPPGYAPMPDDLRAQARAAAAAILDYVPAAAGEPSSSDGRTPSTRGSGGNSGGGQGTTSGPGGKGAAATSPPGAPPGATAVPKPPAATAPTAAGPGAKTLGIAVGFVRFVLPVALIIGGISAVGAFISRRARTSASATSL